MSEVSKESIRRLEDILVKDFGYKQGLTIIPGYDKPLLIKGNVGVIVFKDYFNQSGKARLSVYLPYMKDVPYGSKHFIIEETSFESHVKRVFDDQTDMRQKRGNLELDLTKIEDAVRETVFESKLTELLILGPSIPLCTQ